MGTKALARKWRPHNFETIVGQEHAVRILSHALDTQRLHHAWLFTGLHGVGKTTFARILAKSLNCASGISSKPCGTCQICRECDAGKFIDLLEIDAASRTKVEDTRELLDSISYAPVRGRFRIYLIDEVHMLSGHSFNALLKTLEEPPDHVKFLLATTDPDRLPLTVLSRCLQIHLHPVSPEKIADHLAGICAEEQIPATPEALHAIAAIAKGSLRDALSFMEQAIAFSKEGLTTDEIHRLTGLPGEATLLRLLECLLEYNGSALLEAVQALAQSGPDFDQVTGKLLSILHHITVLQVVPDQTGASSALRRLAEAFTPEAIQLYYQIALNGRRDLPFSPDPASGFEMIMLRMLAFVPETLMETPAASHEATTAISSPPVTIQSTEAVTPPAGWQAILAQLSLSGLTQALAAHCQLISFEHNRMELQLGSRHASLLNKSLTDRLQKALSDWSGNPVKLNITLASHAIETPASLQQAQHQAQQETASQLLQNDRDFQTLINTFDATLDPASIQAGDSD